MHERKVALIPRVVVSGAMGPKEYGLVLTDRRAIFVLESASKAGLGAALGGAIGAAIAQGVAEKRFVDYDRADPDELAGEPKNLVVPYEALEEVRLKHSLGAAKLHLAFFTSEGKRKKVEGVLVPPDEWTRSKKAAGVKPKVAAAEYARTAQVALQSALPPAVAAKAEWSL